jgi:hypothetical protein
MLCKGWVPDVVTLRGAKLGDLSKPNAPEWQTSSESTLVDEFQIIQPADFALYEISDSFHACAATAVAGAIDLTYRKKHPRGLGFQPSTKFLYYTGRYLQFRERENAGASIFATLRASQVMGFCREDHFPVGDGDWNVSPTAELYREAENWGVARFYRLERSINSFKRVLLSGYPFLFGAYVEEKLLTSSGRFAAPATRPEDRHCMLAIGYSDEDRSFTVRDGIKNNRDQPGYVRIAYEYLESRSLTDDFWVITDVARKDEQLDGDDTLERLRGRYVNVSSVFRSVAERAYRTVGAEFPPPPPEERATPLIAERILNSSTAT